jgi:putative N6-adenine-specific DNA methylase
MKIIAKTLYGLEEVLAEELVTLGALNVKAGNRAVVFEGNKSLLYRVNYNSRVALSFMVPLNEYSIRKPSDLYDGAFNLPWDNYLDASQTFAITSVVTSKHFTHTGYPALVVKDAIADYFRRRTSKRPTVDSRSPDIQVNLHISHDRVTLSLDSTVVPLFKRGYREEQGVAPLNEVLAAGIIMLSGWKANTPLIDGMCGSGTIVAEAGLMACNIAPGSFRRNFGFMKWKDYDENLFRSIKFDAEKKVRKSTVPIYGRDISEEAVRIAKSNITACGLNDTVTITQADFLASEEESESGTLIMNPPYGQRIGLLDQNAFYREMGSRMKHFYSGYKAWILSGDRDSLQAVGLKTFKKFDLYNGNIECRLHGYDLYKGSKKQTETD